MKPKKIAVFATGWGEGVLESFLKGITEGFKDTRTDLYLFLCYATLYDAPDVRAGEVNIFSLPNLADFDGAIIYGNSLDFNDIFHEIVDRCHQAGIPTVVTGRKGDDFCFIGSDNYTGAYALAEHLITDHNLRDFFIMEGAPDNMDSNIRKQACLDALNKHNIPFDSEKNVCSTLWNPELAKQRLIEIHDSNEKMPDVFVCANDVLAMACANTLIGFGYNIPEDIKVTGYDHEIAAQIFDPSICSVDQNLPEIGRTCAEVIIDTFNGKPLAKEKLIPSFFWPSESCGCMTAHDLSSFRKRACKKIFIDHMEDSLLENNITRIERTVNSGNCYEDLRDAFKSAFSNTSEYLGPSAHIVLEPNYKKAVTNPSKNFKAKGYSRIMDAIFSLEHGEYHTFSTFETSKLVPYIENGDQNRFFMFLPLHNGDDSYGYIVFCDDYSKVNNYNHLNKYVSRLNMILIKYLQSLKLNHLNRILKDLNETDPLTHVKNRTAFEALEEDLNKRIASTTKPKFGIAMFDVNNLKKVNDANGHDVGDSYIIDCCHLICDYFKHSPIYRIGGDEFLVYLVDDDLINSDIILLRLRDRMDELKTMELPVEKTLSAASGLAYYNPETDNDFTDVFKRADEAMYENKQIMKMEGDLR